MKESQIAELNKAINKANAEETARAAAGQNGGWRSWAPGYEIKKQTAAKQVAIDPVFAKRNLYFQGFYMGIGAFVFLALTAIPTAILAAWLGSAAAVAALGMFFCIGKARQALKQETENNWPIRINIVFALVMASLAVKAPALLSIALLIASAVMYRLTDAAKPLIEENPEFTSVQVWHLVCFLPAIFTWGYYAKHFNESEGATGNILYFFLIAACVFVLLRAGNVLGTLHKATNLHRQLRYEAATFLEMQTPPIPSTRKNVNHFLANLDPYQKSTLGEQAKNVGIDVDFVLQTESVPLASWIIMLSMIVCAPLALVALVNGIASPALKELDRIANIREGDEDYQVRTQEHAGMNDVQKV